MTFFTFTDQDYILSSAEKTALKSSIFADVHDAAPVLSPWMPHVPSVSFLLPFIAVMSRPAVAVFALVLVIGVGTGMYPTMYSAPARSSETVTAATDEIILALAESRSTVHASTTHSSAEMRAGMSTDMSKDMNTESYAQSAAFSADTPETTLALTAARNPVVANHSTDSSMRSTEVRVAPLADGDGAERIASQLAVIDAALTGSSSVRDIPLVPILVAISALQHALLEREDSGVATGADAQIARFIEDRKPLLALLVDTASPEDRLAIHTAAAEFVVEDVRKTQGDAQSVFAESLLATTTYEDTGDFLDDLSVVRVVSHDEGVRL